jgi:hypothetical protein
VIRNRQRASSAGYRERGAGLGDALNASGETNAPRFIPFLEVA